MKKVEIADTVASATNYQLDDGRIIRIHTKLITPEAQLADADFVEIETRGFEVTKSGAFVVDDDGVPVMIAPQRARIPLGNVRAGVDSVKPGWIKQTLPDDEAAKAAALDPHKKLKNLPKTSEPGELARVGDELYTWTDGLYESVRRGRIAETAAAASAAANKPKLDQASIDALKP